MTGKVELFAVFCIAVVAAVQNAASEGLERSRRQTPPLPASLPPMMTPPRTQQLPNLWSCCPRMPSVLKTQSRVGCVAATVRPPMPGGAMPVSLPGGVPPAGVPLPPVNPPTGIPRSNPGNHSCFVECAYKNQALVTGGVLSITGVKARLTEIATENPAWAEVFNAAALACTVNPPVVAANAPCKSGAAEMNSCLTHYVLKNCPTGTRVVSDKCTALRRNVSIPQWG